MSFFRQLELLHELSTEILKDDELLIKRNHRVRRLFGDQLEILNGKISENTQLLLEQSRVQVKIEQLEISELNRNLSFLKAKREQVLVTSLDLLREFMDSDFKRDSDSAAFRQRFVLKDLAISYIEDLSIKMGGDWLFQIQLIRQSFLEKVKKTLSIEGISFDELKKIGEDSFDDFKQLIGEATQLIGELKNSLSSIPTQRYKIHYEDLNNWKIELNEKKKELNDLVLKFGCEFPQNIEEGSELEGSFLLNYATFSKTELPLSIYEIKELAKFSKKEGSFYEETLKILSAREEQIEKLFKDYKNDQFLLGECRKKLFTGHIREAEKSFAQSNRRFSDIGYVDFTKFIHQFTQVRQEMEKCVEKLSLNDEDPSFFKLILKNGTSIVGEEEVRMSIEKIQKKITRLPSCLFKERLEQEVLEHIRFIESRKNVQNESRSVARFASLFVLVLLLSTFGYFYFGWLSKEPEGTPYFIDLDSDLVNKVEVLIAGSTIMPKPLHNFDSHRYPLPKSKELLVFRSADLGDFHLDVDLKNISSINMSAEVRALLEGKKISDIQVILDKSLNDYVSLNLEYEKTKKRVSDLLIRKELSENTLNSYYERYPAFAEKAQSEFQHEASENFKRIKNQIHIHKEAKKSLEKDLKSIQLETVKKINQFILENVLLEPILETDSAEKVFETDFFKDGDSSVVARGSLKARSELIVDRLLQPKINDLNGNQNRLHQIIYLKHFPVQIRDQALRDEVKLNYEKWRALANGYDEKLEILELKLETHLIQARNQQNEFSDFNLVVKPLKLAVQDLDRLIVNEESRLKLFKEKMESLDTNVADLQGETKTESVRLN